MTVGAIMAGAALAQAGSSAQPHVTQTIASLGGTGLQTAISAIHSQWRKGGGKTIVSASQNLRVEPLVLIDERVSRLSSIKDVLEGAQRLFTSYYLLSVALENNIGSVSVQKRLGKFSPDRDLLGAGATYLSALSTESYQFGLPFQNEKIGFEKYGDFSPEAHHPHYSTESKGGSDVLKQATEIHSLSIGQIVNVNITSPDGKNSASIPVMIRMRTIGASPVSMVNILGLGMEDNSRAARLLKFRVGALGLKDLITNQDRIDEYRRASFTDKTGYFRKAHARANKGLLATILSGEPSIGTISSIAIISRQTQRELENHFYGSLDDFSRRQQVFDKSLLMMLIVVDDDANTVTIYTRDIEDKQTFTLDDFQKSSKGNNNDLTDLLKAFMSGNIPGRL